jgi:GMP synthase-like glutamine amidotransferase
MHLTIIETGEVPEALRPSFGTYPDMFAAMMARHGQHSFETVAVHKAEALPDPEKLDAVMITGSPAGVYEDHAWLDPLFGFIRAAYAAETPMAGICFGHQAMARALGGVVEKSDRGWGMGRHSYRVAADAFAELPETIAIACSHQDQVLVPPPGAKVFLSSDFAPYAGLVYDNGAALSVQPHPEFSDDYAMALAELRRGRAPDVVVEAALNSFSTPSDSVALSAAITRFLTAAAQGRSSRARSA